MRRVLIRLFVILVGYVILCIYVANNDEIEERPHKIKSIKPIEKSSMNKTIVLWTVRYRKADWGLDYKSELFKNCPEPRCKFILGNETVLNSIDQYDAFLYYVSARRFRFSKPIKRYPHQIYAFVSQEAPQKHHLKAFNINYNNFFNYTSEFLMNRSID